MQKIIVGFVGAAIVLIGGWYLVAGNDKEAMMAEKAAMEKMEMEEKMKMEEKAAMEKAEMEKAEMMKADEMKKDEDAAMMKKDEAMMTPDTMKKDEMKKAEDQAMADDDMMKKAGTYAAYDASKLAMANSGDVVLFFKAAWCPSCRTLDSNIKANLDAIPAGLTILEVDYDSATALKQKYGVTSQHTLVQVDAAGTQLKKWSGGATLASVVAQVQ
jgi:thioredoxin 1